VTARGFFEDVTVVFEVLGVVVLCLGLVLAVVVAGVSVGHGRGWRRSVSTFRNAFGGALLLALEILIAADLTRTLTVEPTMENVLVLGVIVLIRTVLSFSLEVEMDGVLPWRRRALESGAVAVARAVRDAGTPSAS
jgi:uncharacterized membrane protein